MVQTMFEWLVPIVNNILITTFLRIFKYFDFCMNRSKCCISTQMAGLTKKSEVLSFGDWMINYHNTFFYLLPEFVCFYFFFLFARDLRWDHLVPLRQEFEWLKE